MQLKSIILICGLTLGITPFTHSAQNFDNSTSTKKEVSIVKNVAATLKTNENKNTDKSSTVLNQLVYQSTQKNTQNASSEEAQAMHIIRAKQPSYLSLQNKKFSEFLQSLFGG